jgi:choline dehydrogenase-like flavoprotein
MRDYVHWATLGALCEFLPQARNRVTLADEVDRHGLAVAHFAYSQGDNDKQLMKAAQASMELILKAAGAQEVITIDRYAHLVGGARMAQKPEQGVIDADHRIFGTPNAFIVDGSTLPTQGSANPALTIMALAARAADRLIELARTRQPAPGVAS